MPPCRPTAPCGWPSARPTCSAPGPPTTRPGSTCPRSGGVVEVARRRRRRRTADVAGMCTYEHLVDATLPARADVPLVVPQLRTITLGGAVTGLGIESTIVPQRPAARVGARDGRSSPATGEVVTATPAASTPTSSDAFPNSYGSLGYATRLRIELEPVPPFVAPAPRPVRRRCERSPRRSAESSTTRHVGRRAGRLVDGVVFAPTEAYLTPRHAGPTSRGRPTQRLHRPAGLLPLDPAARRPTVLTMHDYLWRWDTDWFWCSRRLRRPAPAPSAGCGRAAGGAATSTGSSSPSRPALRRRRPARPARRAARSASASSRTSRCRSTGSAEFLAWFDARWRCEPVWLCPLRLRRDREALADPYPLDARRRPTSTSASGRPSHVGPERAPTAPRNRAIEAKVPELGGHKSLYSEAFYDRGRPSTALYGGADLAPREGSPTTPTTGCPTSTTRRCDDDEHRPVEDRARHDRRRGGSAARDGMPVRVHGVRRQRGRAAGRRRSGCELRQPARRCLPRSPRPGDLGLARAYVARRPRHRTASHPGDPYDAARAAHRPS